MKFPVLELGIFSVNLFTGELGDITKSRSRASLELLVNTLFVDSDGRIWRCKSVQFIRHCRPWWNSLFPGSEPFRQTESLLNFQEEPMSYSDLVALTEKIINSEELQSGCVIRHRPIQEIVHDNLLIMNNPQTSIFQNFSAFMRIRKLEKRLKADPSAEEIFPEYLDLYPTWMRIRLRNKIRACADAQSLVKGISSVFEESLKRNKCR